MADFCNYLLIQTPDVRRVSEELEHVLAEVGVKVVAPETVGAHHATLSALRDGSVVLWFEDDWHPFDRPLARPLSRRLGSPVASCFLHGRGEVEAVTLCNAGEPLASYLIASDPALWEVTRSTECIFRLDVPRALTNEDEDDEDEDEDEDEARYAQQLAALRKAQRKAFKSFPFSSLLQSTRWHELSPGPSAHHNVPSVALSFLDEAEDLAAVRRFDEGVEQSLGAALAQLGFVRTTPDHRHLIALVRDEASRRLRVQFSSRRWDPFETVNVHLDWLAFDEECETYRPTGQQVALVRDVPLSALSTALAREGPVLQLFAPALHADLTARGYALDDAGADGEGQATARIVDTGQQLYDSAMESRARGKERACRAHLRYLVEEYPGNPRARDARDVLTSPRRTWLRRFFR